MSAIPASVRADKILASLSDAEVIALAYDWSLWRRPSQVTPEGEDWDIWMVRSGRGYGKTRMGAEFIRDLVNNKGYRRLHLVARTAADARDTMVEGESGLLSVCAGDMGNVPVYEPSKRQVTWPNGAIAKMFSAEEPDALRGPQCEAWWADELAAWKYVQDAWDNLMFGARLGSRVLGIVTTTPRPIPLIKELIKDSRTRVTRGSTYENRENLSSSFIKRIEAKYKGTRLGRQELDGEILDDNPGALWRRADIEKGRVTKAPELALIRVAVDPAVSATEASCETGIVVVGRDYQDPPHFYVLDDCTLAQASPASWGSQAVAAYHRHQADGVVAEVNNGGDMVVSTISVVDASVPVKPVHASRGKKTRAEPVSALSEQGRLHMVGAFPELEDQLCEWDPSANMDSPDRLDAMVWGVTSLMEGNQFGVAIL